jgi:hypothetical protein
MPHENVLELVLLEDFVVDVENRAARVSEDVLDSLLLQAPNEDFGTCYRRGLGFRAIHFCADGLHLLILSRSTGD